jgi:hypothetical protein
MNLLNLVKLKNLQLVKLRIRVQSINLNVIQFNFEGINRLKNYQ